CSRQPRINRSTAEADLLSNWFFRLGCSKCSADDIEKFVVINGLMEKAGSSGCQSASLKFFRLAAGDDHERNVFGLVDPADPGHDEKTIPGNTASMADVG